jgi:hypothetical protein
LASGEIPRGRELGRLPNSEGSQDEEPDDGDTWGIEERAAVNPIPISMQTLKRRWKTANIGQCRYLERKNGPVNHQAEHVLEGGKVDDESQDDEWEGDDRHEDLEAESKRRRAGSLCCSYRKHGVCTPRGCS